MPSQESRPWSLKTALTLRSTRLRGKPRSRVSSTLGRLCRLRTKRSQRQKMSGKLLPRTTRSFVTVNSKLPNWRAENRMASFFRAPFKASSGIGASSIWHCLSAVNSKAVRFAAPLFRVAALLSAHSSSASFWLITWAAYVVHPKQIYMTALQPIAWGSVSSSRINCPNLAINLTSFDLWIATR